MVERPEKVRAELYRVQNGETNEGDRLVSDTPFMAVPAVPDPIPTIKLENPFLFNNSHPQRTKGKSYCSFFLLKKKKKKQIQNIQ